MEKLQFTEIKITQRKYGKSLCISNKNDQNI
jgi:hypothetical protein